MFCSALTSSLPHCLQEHPQDIILCLPCFCVSSCCAATFPKYNWVSSFWKDHIPTTFGNHADRNVCVFTVLAHISTIFLSHSEVPISFWVQFRALLLTHKGRHDLEPEGLPRHACSHKAVLLFPSKVYYQHSNYLRPPFLTCGTSWPKSELQSLWKWLLQSYWYVHALFCF